MAFRLRYLSAAVVLAGAGVWHLWLHDSDRAIVQAEAAKLSPALNQIVDQSKATIQSLANAVKVEKSHDPVPEADQAKLPFIIIEPRDFASPAIRLPQQRVRELTPPEAVTELRMAKVEDPLLQMDLNPVEARLRAKIPAELIGYFDLYLYVSKATSDKGDWAQKMFVLAKDKEQHGALTLLHNWKVSTGLEAPLPSPTGRMLGTSTPQGIFKLDRQRFHQDYTSRQWQSPMPYAMFFDWLVDGRQSGLAVHGTDEEGVKTLGQRASHGCIRLETNNARTLFELIQTNYRGRVPVFAVDEDAGTMSTTGALAHNEDGTVKMTRGYKVLVFIEDFGGPSVDTVAALY